MPLNLLIATRNKKKKKELQEILSDLNISLLNLDDIASLPEVEEDGLTFSDNAVKKAVTTAKLTGLLTLADDSGLVVDALDGAPGVYSARYAGPDADDEKNNQKLLLALESVADQERTACFMCVIALADPDGSVQIVEGSCEGHIRRSLQGSEGFGYDPLFIPAGYEQSFAELPPHIKNSISHRGKALAKVKPLLQELLTREESPC